MRPFQTSDFYFDLPKNLIAQYPLKERSASRLLYLNKSQQSMVHTQFVNLLDYLHPQDLLIFNNTKVMPARLHGKKVTGGAVECLIERIIDEHLALAHIRGGKSLRPQSSIIFSEKQKAIVLGRKEELFELYFTGEYSLKDLLLHQGEIPLPPYIERNAETLDISRYQTIYAQTLGAVAAPTAGLHFDEQLLNQIKAKGIEIAFITLHVGAGTFQPVRVADLNQHRMHSEYMELSEAVCKAIKACRARKGRVIAVGTTAVRCLETAATINDMKPYRGETDIFIRPGYSFKCVDALITNFHLPESSLLMLVSAFAGYDFTMRAYQEAIQQQYRFFSYGDAMFIKG